MTEQFPSTPDDAKALGVETHEDPDFALSESYFEILQAQNPDADPETLSRAAVIVTRLLEPLALSDDLTYFSISVNVCGLEFEIEQID